jgi:plastocyanin/heme-degrading monooxygenase HmoA
MEYIQTILFQIPASRLEQAMESGGLFSQLDEHREYLRNQVGFRDLRITRSINTEGNVLVVVETRWTDDSSLVRYETTEPNAASIVRSHDRVIMADTLQVLDMEALRTESSWKASEEAQSAAARVTLPIVIPLAVLAFALLVIYGLSRIYLEIGGNGAVALAAGLAIFVLMVAFYLALNPRVPGWQIGGLVVVLGLLLLGGTIWAVAEEDESEAEETASEQPGGEEPGGEEPGGEEPGGGGEVLVLGDNFFEYNGEQEPTITVPAGEETVLPLVNQGNTTHNMQVNASGEFAPAPCEPGGDNPCSDPNIFRADQEGEIAINLDAGEYDFRCDFHPDEMTGTLVVE